MASCRKHRPRGPAVQWRATPGTARGAGPRGQPAGAVLLPAGCSTVLFHRVQGSTEQVFDTGDERTELRSGRSGHRAQGDVLSLTPQVGFVVLPQLGQEAVDGGSSLGLRRRILAQGLGDMLDQGLRHDLRAELAIDPQTHPCQVQGVVAQFDPLAAQVGAIGVAVALQGDGSELVHADGLAPEEDFVQAQRIGKGVAGSGAVYLGGDQLGLAVAPVGNTSLRQRLGNGPLLLSTLTGSAGPTNGATTGKTIVFSGATSA